MDGGVLAPDAKREPWWWEAVPRRRHDDGPLPKQVDVAILGAGFTGLSAALVLARAGRGVLVLDAEDVGQGASSRNGGMVGSGHRVPFSAMIDRYGEPTARAIVGEGLAALEFTVDLIEREQIRCDFKRCGRFHGAWRPSHYDAFGREIDLMKRTFGVEADLLSRGETRDEIASDVYHGAVLYHSHGGLHPGKFHDGLLDRATAAGAAVLGHAPVTAVARDGDAFAVTCSKGSLRARDVIVATNGYTGGVTPDLKKRLAPIASFIIATEELGEERVRRLLPKGRMMVESRMRHCYYRPSPDGRRILLGARAALRAVDPGRTAAINHRLLRDIFPELRDVKVTHSWNGFVAFARDRLPHLGRRDGIHHALGYGGSGVAMAPYLGHKVAHQVLGDTAGDSPFTHTPFDPVPAYERWPLALRLGEWWYRLKDWREGSG